MNNKQFTIAALIALAFTVATGLFSVAALSSGFFTACYIYIALMAVCGFATIRFVMGVQYDVR